MRPAIVICCFALAAATPSVNHPAFYAVVSPASLSSQYHAQDTLGQYNYGYSAGSSAKAESKTVDGVVRGGYSYLDGNGVVQTANYITDDANGFRVAVTNLPRNVYDTPEVAAAKVAHSVAYNKAAYAAAVSPDFGEAVVVPAAVVSSYVASPQAANFVKQLPSTAFSYSAAAASHSVAASPSVTPISLSASPVVSAVEDAPSKAFSYSTIEAAPLTAAPRVTPISASASPVVSVVKDAPSKAFSYSIIEADPLAAAPRFTPITVSASPVVSVVKDVASKAFAYSNVPTSSSVSLVSAPAAVAYSIAAENLPVAPVLDVKQVSAAPYPAVVSSTSQQYHAQDDLGQYTYGYAGGPSAKVETKTVDGVTRGKYSYVDANGVVQSASYIADDVNGFRVAATNIPVGPSSPVLQKVLVSPLAVDNQLVADTPQIVAAKSAHFTAPVLVKYGY